jgi:hypothetical protein
VERYLPFSPVKTNMPENLLLLRQAIGIAFQNSLVAILNLTIFYLQPCSDLSTELGTLETAIHTRHRAI